MNKSITTVVMDTETHVLSRRALDLNLQRFPTHDVLVYTNREEYFEGFTTKKVEKFRSISDYDEAIIRRLPEDIKTDFALIIHYDGFVINPSQFSPHFLHYDYVGAPWPNFEQHNVGNGGFCLRSKRLLDSTLLYADQRCGEPDDTFISRILRSRLELKHNCLFAPAGLAQHFSSEFVFHPWPTFGFHGFVMLPFVYKDEIPFLLENLPDRAFSGDKLKQMGHFFNRAAPEIRELFLKRTEAALEMISQG